MAEWDKPLYGDEWAFEEARRRSQANDPLASERARAANTVMGSAESPEVKAKMLELQEEEIRKNDQLIKQAEKRLAKEKAIEAVKERTRKAEEEARKDNMREMRILAKEAGAWDVKTGGFIIFDKDGNQIPMTPDEYKKAVQAGKDISEKEREKIERLHSQIESRMVAPGMTNMREGTAGGLLDKAGFHIGDLISAVTTGNYGGILRELMQPFGGGRWEQRVKDASARMGERGLERGGLRGLAQRGLGGLIGKAPLLAAPGALLAAQQVFSRGSQMTRDVIGGGQITGGGFGEGLAARGEARRLSWNPFDMMDQRTATQIVSGLRSRGFTGELGRALQDTVGDVFQDLGTDIEQSMDMVTTVVKANIMSLDEFRDTMRNLDDQAKATGLSVKAVQENLKSVMDVAGAAGGAEAMGIAMARQESFNEAFRSLEVTRQGQLPTVLQPLLQTGAKMFGMPAWLAGSAQAQQEAGRIFDQIAEFLWNMMQRFPEPFNTINGLALWLAGPGQALGLTGGLTDVTQIELFLKALFKTREAGGWERKLRKDARKRVENEARQALSEGKKMDRRGWKGILPGFGMIADKISGGDDQRASLGIRRSLSEMKEEMRASGVPEERIAEILRPGREIAFSKKIGDEERSERYDEIFERLLERTQQEISLTVDMRPEASRWLQGLNQPRTEYISGGKNSQYTLPPPPLRGG